VAIYLASSSAFLATQRLQWLFCQLYSPTQR